MGHGGPGCNSLAFPSIDGDAFLVSYIDAVLNHKFGAEHTEKFKAIEVDWDDRTRDVSGVQDIAVCD